MANKFESKNQNTAELETQIENFVNNSNKDFKREVKPKKAEADKKKPTPIYLTDKEKEALKQKAKEHRMSLSQYIAFKLLIES